MNKDEQFALGRSTILERIKTWADLYEFFDELMHRVHETGHPGFMLDALLTMYAFTYAMRELPEEGDIQKLAERMLRILIYESQEKLGMEVNILTPEEMTAILQKHLNEAVVSGAAETEEATGPPRKPRVFH